MPKKKKNQNESYMQRQIFRVERIYSYPLQIVVRIPKKRTYRRDSINTLNATLVSFACDATMNFLLCDTYNVEILPTRGYYQYVTVYNYH